MSWSWKKGCWNAFITFAYVDSNLNKSYSVIFFPNGFAIWEIHTRSINPLRSTWFRSRNYGCLVTWFCYPLTAKPGKRQLQFNDLTHINCPPFQSIHYYLCLVMKYREIWAYYWHCPVICLMIEFWSSLCLSAKTSAADSCLYRLEVWAEGANQGQVLGKNSCHCLPRIPMVVLMD